jgi:hypothetical protein
MNTIPQVLDPFIRTIRTALQVLIACASLLAPLAAVWPSIVGAIRADDASTVGIWLAASVAWVTTGSAVAARIMAIPGVNLLLQRIGLAGHSGGVADSADTLTSLFPAQAVVTNPIQ